MSQLKYHLLQKGQARVAIGGEQKHYASITQINHVTIKELRDMIASRCTLTSTNVIALLISLSRKIPNYLLNGGIDKLGDLGNFSINITLEGSVGKEDITTTNIIYNNTSHKPPVYTKQKFQYSTIP